MVEVEQQLVCLTSQRLRALTTYDCASRSNASNDIHSMAPNLLAHHYLDQPLRSGHAAKPASVRLSTVASCFEWSLIEANR